MIRLEYSALEAKQLYINIDSWLEAKMQLGVGRSYLYHEDTTAKSVTKLAQHCVKTYENTFRSEGCSASMA